MPKQDNPLGTLFMMIRQAALMVADAIEVYSNITPRTSVLRKKAKSEVVEQRTGDEVI